MKNWVESKLKGLDELASQKVSDDLAIIDDRLAYASKEVAEKAAKDIGCEGVHEHEFEDQMWYMPCQQHNLKAPCQDGYEQIGMKEKDGRKVPNCVPIQ